MLILLVFVSNRQTIILTIGITLAIFQDSQSFIFAERVSSGEESHYDNINSKKHVYILTKKFFL